MVKINTVLGKLSTEDLGISKKAQGNGLLNLTIAEQRVEKSIKITIESENLQLPSKSVVMEY